MKNKYFNKLIIIVLLLSFGSCQSYTDDFFKIERPQELQWTTTATFEQGLSRCYYNIQWTYAGGLGYPQFLDFLLSGNAMLSPGTAVGQQGEQVMNRIFEPNGIYEGVWNTGYNTIAMCNLAIDFHKNDPEGNPLHVSGTDYTDNYLRQVAEYHFCRGYTYWWLSKLWAPRYKHNGDNSSLAIPLKSTTSLSMKEVQNEKIGTVEEVYQQVIDDLKYAKENLPDKFNKNSWNNVPGYECGRANKWVATAMLGKVYFLMGKYAEAKAEFDELISYAKSTGAYQIVEEPRAAYIEERAWNVAKESIWEFNSGFLEGSFQLHNQYMYPGRNMGFRNRDSNGHELETSPLPNVGTTLGGFGGGVAVTVGYTALKQFGWMADPLNGDYTITPKAEADLRYKQVYHLMLPYKSGIVKGDPRYITTESFSGHSLIVTPVVYLDKFFRGAYPYGKFSKFPLIKLADIYLLSAWLRWKGNDPQGAADYLNIVWNRSNPTNTNIYTAANVTHQAIYIEYMKEMTGEGWTCDFMMGTQMTIPKGDANLIQGLAVDPNKDTPPPYSGWYWPIPPGERALNPNYNK